MWTGTIGAGVPIPLLNSTQSRGKVSASAPAGHARQFPPLLSSVHVTGLFDAEYLAALRDRNAEAEERLITWFSVPLRAKLRARLRSPELVQDGVQETFLRVLSYFRAGKTLDNPASLPGFVHSTCHNVAMELLRSHTRHPQIPEGDPDPVDRSMDPERDLVTNERKDRVRTVLNQLSEKDRQLLRRVFLDEENKDTVCREFEVDRTYLRVLLYRARQKFRDVVMQQNRRTTAAARG